MPLPPKQLENDETIPPTGAARDYQLIFTGNASITDKQLRASAETEFQHLRSAGQNKAAIDDAAFQMELLYRRSGFPNAVVSYTFDDRSGHRQVIFHIDEGPKVTVRTLELTGALKIPPQTLLGLYHNQNQQKLKIPGQPYIETEWPDLVREIKRFYLEHGFLDVQVQGPVINFSPDRASADIVIHIQEGSVYHLRQLRFSGSDLSVAAEPLQEIAHQYQGTAYSPRLKITLKNKIMEVLQNEGFAEAAVRMISTTKQGDVLVNAEIATGPRVTISEIRISGNERTKEGFIRSLLTVKAGTVYSLEAMQESFSNLYRTGLFSSVNIELLGKDDMSRRPVGIELTERPAREVYFEPGWGSYELARFTAGYRDSNIFGNGRSLRLDGGASLKGRNLLIGFTDPWLLGHETTLDLPFYYSYREEPSYTEEKIGVTVQANKTLTRYSTISGGYFYESSHLFDISEDSVLTTADSDYVTAGGRAQLTRDTRDDIFFPSKGYKGNIMLEFSDPVFGSELSYTRFVAGINTFFPLPLDYILGLRWKSGFILPVSRDNNLPLSERFFNGGENTVRSFRESDLGPLDINGDPIGGTAYNVFNIELRKKLGHRLAGSIFIDVGNVVPGSYTNGTDVFWNGSRSSQWQETFSNYFNDMRSGIGFGLQYLLPVGPLRLDIAFNPDKRPRENDYAIHFSIGMAF